MTLDQYLTDEKLTAADFGAKCDPAISEASISRIRRGTQNISSDVMLAIIRASDGKVTAEGLLSVRNEAA
jgi:DNA-binding transcriptional regulator YdaS (Cro superfamily)